MTDVRTFFPWNTGQPTKPEVDALLKAYPPENMKQGEWRVTDEEMRAHLSSNCTDARYRTICNKWRQVLADDHGVNILRVAKLGYHYPNDDEQLATTDPQLMKGKRLFRRQKRFVARVKPTTDFNRLTQEHQGRLLNALEDDARKARMNVLPSTAAPTTPAIQPPRKRNGDNEGGVTA